MPAAAMTTDVMPTCTAGMPFVGTALLCDLHDAADSDGSVSAEWDASAREVEQATTDLTEF